MNERFRQLADQAQIGLFEDKSFGWSVIAGTDQHLSKFAELIVRECARIASASPYPYKDIELILDGRQTWDQARSEAGHEIQKYFGVEESGVDEQLRNRSTYFGNDI